jgi:primase-polymerase (primpol)-like protein
MSQYKANKQGEQAVNKGNGGPGYSGAGGKPQAHNGNLRQLPAALAPLVALPHWVLWRWEPVGDIADNKWTKVPYQPNGRHARTNDPATWTTYDAVIAVVDRFDGLGFSLLNSGFAAFDNDKCRDKVTGRIHQCALDLVAKCGSYAEITPSGTGLRVIGYGNGGAVDCWQQVIDGVSLETYRNAARYITMTGNQLPGSAQELRNIDAHIDATVAELTVDILPAPSPKPTR